MSKHTKLFYRAIARIRAIGANPGAVYVIRLARVWKINYGRAYELKQELLDAGVLKEWKLSKSWKSMERDNSKGNIVWKNMSKFHVPKEVTIKETERVRKEKERGFFDRLNRRASLW